MPEAVATKPSVKRLIPVLVNRVGNVQIQCGSGAKGSFDGSKMLLLLAGTNLVKEEQWVEAEKQKSVQRLMTVKIRATGAPEDAEARIGRPIIEVGKPLSADNPLLDLSIDEALIFVSRTESLKLLKELATQTADGQVMQAINQRIRFIEDPKNQPEKKRT